MSRPQTATRRREETPVDDVRRVRERLSREAGGDVRRLADQSRRAAKKYRRKLGLKSAAPATRVR